MGNYFSEMNCIKATVITETNTEPYFEEVKKIYYHNLRVSAGLENKFIFLKNTF